MSEDMGGFFFSKDPYDDLAYNLGRYNQTTDPYKKARFLYDALNVLSEEEEEEAGITFENLEEMEKVMIHVVWKEAMNKYFGDKLYVGLEEKDIDPATPNLTTIFLNRYDHEGWWDKYSDKAMKKRYTIFFWMTRSMYPIARKLKDFLTKHNVTVPITTYGEPPGEEKRKVKA